MRKILLVVYTMFLFIFALASSTLTYFNYSFETFVSEVFIDIVFIAGAIIYINKKHLKLWGRCVSIS